MGINTWRPQQGPFRVAAVAVAAGLLAVAGMPASSAEAQTGPPPDAATNRPTSPLLPAYYARAFDVAGQRARLVRRENENDFASEIHATDDGAVILRVDRHRCDRSRCDAMFRNVLGHLNAQATQKSGAFQTATESEIRVAWRDDPFDETVALYKLPGALLYWTYRADARGTDDVAAYFDRLTAMVDRQRYESARADSNVALGSWAPQIHAHARRLLQDGARGEALDVLQKLVASSPYRYTAHIDLAANTRDPQVARNSARAVLANAEDPELLAKAAALLPTPPPAPAPVPALQAGERGLQLILIPLAPCRIQLLEEAAPIYQRITGIPVKIRRLSDEWDWGPADRLPNLRTIQETIIRLRGGGVEFAGWSAERYGAELLKSAESANALTRYYVQGYVDALKEQPGQHRVSLHLGRFVLDVAGLRSNDVRTMYVGVTETNIYSGDSNFVISEHVLSNGGASILSYAMMMAKTLNEPYESRKRLVERIAKELLPASLKSLGIPRPADPSDPYSYADSVKRMDEKSLTLSPPVKAAIARFRY